MVSTKFNPEEPSAVVEQTQAMHDSVKAFMEMNFASYLRLGELNLASLRHLCRDSDTEENPLEGRYLSARPSSNPRGN